MVIVRLLGGLGNQLFQYAMARRIAYEHQVPIKLDVSSYDIYKLRTYRLHHFNIMENFASVKEINDLIEAGKIAKERQFCFDEQMMHLPGDIYLDGYWQCEKYFENVSNLIRHEFQLKAALSDQDEELIKKIRNVQSISIHVRRGDYVFDEYNHHIHGTCSLEYYHFCIEQLAAAFDKPNFFVFSDDKQWVQDHIKVKYPITFVTHNDIDKEYADLFLMSNCKHHIIANSSFSWWAAWLCTYDKKKILSPAKWFHSHDYDGRDIIPKGWYQV
ncbi:alpha-1,2-fucosyltransferase [Pelosinus propionicus]|uniref:Glycosyl transferase family 11 n=1 Tax=Pelosinus propionicus DSM 13327 TaxID=1123291 RepID=A0A1I4JQN9_9FIRM|nr:alpha-1,2-fucosyltransferase [Pelosinus propionicus]SFL68869.1 Glycosyl transferase family 11 [Pelosinus propionicus DSM 13327]